MYHLSLCRVLSCIVFLGPVGAISAFGDESDLAEVNRFSRESNYFRTLAAALVRNGFTKTEHLSAEVIINSVIRRECRKQPYRQIDDTISLLRPVRIVGYEYTASDSREGLKGLWLCKSIDGKVTLVLYDPHAKTTKIKWDVSDSVEFDKMYEILSSAVKESEVVASSNAAHGAVSMFTIADSKRQTVSLRYPLLPWSDKDDPEYKAWKKFGDYIEKIRDAHDDRKR